MNLEQQIQKKYHFRHLFKANKQMPRQWKYNTKEL